MYYSYDIALLYNIAIIFPLGGIKMIVDTEGCRINDNLTPQQFLGMLENVCDQLNLITAFLIDHPFYFQSEDIENNEEGIDFKKLYFELLQLMIEMSDDLSCKIIEENIKNGTIDISTKQRDNDEIGF